MKDILLKFMYGRYGIDKLGYALVITSLCITFLSSFFSVEVGYAISYALIGWEIFRFLSKNIYKRSRENNKFIELKKTFTSKAKLEKNKIRDRKTHKYFECSTCHNNLRVPKGRGELKVTCPI